MDEEEFDVDDIEFEDVDLARLIKQRDSEEDFNKQLVNWGYMLAYFRKNPDAFIDYILPEDSTFRLFPFQRLYLRIMARYRITYLVATRGTSKSFLNILYDYIKCVLYPNSKLAMLAPQKGQASAIAQQNIDEIWKFMPILKGEVMKFTYQKDYTKLEFWNGSVLDIVPVAEGSRGLRKNGLSFEEIVNMEKHREMIGSVILPLLANNRKGADGKSDPYEINKQIKYITTASNKQSYAWETLQMVFRSMAQEEPDAFAIGNGYELPVLFDQLDQEYIDEIKQDPSMSPIDFSREYESKWSGSDSDSLVALKDLEESRVIKRAEFSDMRGAKEKGIDYIIAVDVARSEKNGTATTAIAILKTKEKADGTYIKHLVKLETYKGGMHFKNQAKRIKDLVEVFGASMVVVDGNGVGSGLVDYLIDGDGDYKSYSVVNDRDYDKYKQFDSVPLIFNFKSNTRELNASDVHNNFMAVVAKKDLKLLISDKELEDELGEKEKAKLGKMIAPHIETSRFIDEIMNLKYVAKGHKTEIKRISSQMDKDRYSAVSYGLFYILTLERTNLAKRNKSINTNPQAFARVKKAKYKVFN